MGLFSNNKKLCPICGSPTPRFLATKFENEAICKDCDNKIDLPDGVQGKMTLADFRQYIARYDENATLRSSFSKTFQISYGFLSGYLQVDEAHGRRPEGFPHFRGYLPHLRERSWRSALP